jgi:hypothetical protein
VLAGPSPLSASLQNGNRLSSFFLGGETPNSSVFETSGQSLTQIQEGLASSFDPTSNLALK